MLTTISDSQPPGTALPIRFGRRALATGIRVHYAEAGSAGGEPVLFLHGYTDSWFSFSHALGNLPGGLHGWALDQRGHGDSDRPPGGYAMADLAADAAAFLDAVGVERATVVGHSMGSFVAQQVALRHPDRVARLVLVGSYTSARNDAVAGLRDDVLAFGDVVPEGYAREFQLATTHRPLAPAFLEQVVRESEKLPARVWRALARAMLDEETSGALGAIRCPTLVLWGDRDAFFPRSEQERLRAGIPGAELRVYEDTGHALHWEEPRRFLADVSRFVRSIPAAATIARREGS